MKLLKDMILQKGKVIDDNILKVNSFINHQVDSKLMKEIGLEFANYFKNEEIEKYIVVNEENNPEEIAKKIEYALDNKEKVLGLYKDWEAKNKKMSKELLQEFLEDGANSEK